MRVFWSITCVDNRANTGLHITVRTSWPNFLWSNRRWSWHILHSAGHTSTCCLVHFLFKFFNSCLNPRMSEGFLGREPLIRLPLETPVYKIYKVSLLIQVRLHQHRQLLRVYLPNLALGIGCYNWPVIIIKEYFPARCDHYHRPRWRSLNLHNALHLFLLVFTCKDWKPDI